MKNLFMTDEGYIVKNDCLVGYYGDPLEDDVLVLPDAAATVTKSAVNYARNYVRKVVVPEGVKKLASSCFRGFSELEEVYLPSTLEEIGDNTFAETHLKELRLPDSVRSVGFNFISRTMVSELTLPSGMSIPSNSMIDGSNIETFKMSKCQFDQMITYALEQNMSTATYKPFTNAKYFRTLIIGDVAYNGKRFLDYILHEYEPPNMGLSLQKDYMANHQFTISLMFTHGPFFE